ncbi:hypothetical protein NPIL_62091 [Nephila pilipes]|uniref:Uncharacterized protein n=1 Tax=Nephila pilipes TaxID=299642 RepID=A0A8X6TSU0_NEPPI|nr:hypothetical protein NPIL_62091 [Nephila pilipes]
MENLLNAFVKASLVKPFVTKSIASLPPSEALPRSVLLDCLVACALDVSFPVETSSSPGPSSLWLLLVSRVPDSLCLLSLRSRCFSMKMKIL